MENENKYAASDKQCGEWLDQLMCERFITVEQRELLSRIKTFLNVVPQEELVKDF